MVILYHESGGVLGFLSTVWIQAQELSCTLPQDNKILSRNVKNKLV